MAVPIAQTSHLLTTATVHNTSPVPGDIVTVTVTIRNHGPADAPNTTVEFGRTPVLGNIEYSVDGGVNWIPWPGIVTLNNIPNGGSAQVLIRGEVPVVVSGKVANTIVTRSLSQNPNQTGNISAITATIIPTADLVTTVTGPAESPSPGDSISYYVNVHNNGPSTAAAPYVQFFPPPPLTDVEFSVDGGNTWQPWPGSTTLTDIPNGGDVQIVIRGKVAQNAVETIEMMLAATSSTNDPSIANNTARTQTTIASPPPYPPPPQPTPIPVLPQTPTPAPAATCSVSFFSGNCLIGCSTVKCGAPVTGAPYLFRYGYTFAGWCADCRCFGNQWNFANPVYRNLTLHAKWISCC
jgi:uncharacterized repeat protein (TIGR01451 family)/uncharacterized repeat protein (TIGR02543 family)